MTFTVFIIGDAIIWEEVMARILGSLDLATYGLQLIHIVTVHGTIVAPLLHPPTPLLALQLLGLSLATRAILVAQCWSPPL